MKTAVAPRAAPPIFADLRDPLLLTWSLFLATIPFYVGASGLPQPGNMLLFAIIPIAWNGWNGRMPRGARPALRPLLAFAGWVFLVDYGWAAATGKWDLGNYTIHPLYYIFNAALFYAGILVFQRRPLQFHRVTAYTLVAVAVFLVGASFVVRSAQVRGQLFFNNPNQLGYYALLSACAIAMTHRHAGMRIRTASAGLTGCAYLAVISSSRAAAGGIGILLVFLVFSNPRLIVLGLVAAIGLVSVGGPVSTAIDKAEHRVEVEKAQGSFSEERGYERLWQHPEYMVIGAGEGDYGRFATNGHVREIHSSAATILFSYGILGSIFFLVFAFRVTRGARFRTTAILIPAFAYTIAHQGLRFAMLWVLLAVFMAVKATESAQGARRR